MVRSRIRAALAGEPSHAAFFSPDHPSKGLQVTAAIAAQLAKEAAERGAWGAFVTIPIIGRSRIVDDARMERGRAPQGPPLN